MLGPIRVCFLIDRLNRAGTETQLLALIRSLDRLRILPYLCLLDGEDDLSRSLEPYDCPVLRMGVTSLLGISSLRAAARLNQFWHEQRIDVLQTYFLDSTYFGVTLAKLCGMRKIVRVRNNLGYWLTGRHRRLGRLMGRLADFTLTNSNDGKRSIVEAERLRPEKVVVLENGVDLERFPIRPHDPLMNPKCIRIGAVANLRPVKNIDGLIRAAVLLRKSLPQLQFEVVGDGEQRPELERLIADHRLEDSFKLCGSVDDVPGFLARQDIAVLCSHSEGMSNALLEYMAAGRAIIATDVGANRQLVHDGTHGLIVPPKDDAALSATIDWFVQHPAQMIEMGAAARKRVEAEYSRTAMVRRFEEFYERAVR